MVFGTPEERCILPLLRLTPAWFVRTRETKRYGGGYCSLTPGHPDYITEEQYDAMVRAFSVVSRVAIAIAIAIHFIPVRMVAESHGD